MATSLSRSVSRLSRSAIVEEIGDTPLVEIRRILQSPNVRIMAKLEGFNPGGSIKDRPAYNMVRAGEEKGELSAGRAILDATSGNTGIAYAMIGASRGYHVKLVMPANASLERKKILRAYGAELILTDPLEGSDGAIRKVREIYQENPDLYFYPDQYSNDANWQAHYDSTGPEIYAQTGGEVTHFVAGLGTSGTFMGVSRRLKELNERISCYSFMPDSPIHGLEGLKHMPTSLLPAIYDPSIADGNLEVATEQAQQMVVRLAREEGLFVGISSGAAMAAALRLAEDLEEGVVVTIFCDSGDKYLSEEFWEEY